MNILEPLPVGADKGSAYIDRPVETVGHAIRSSGHAEGKRRALAGNTSHNKVGKPNARISTAGERTNERPSQAQCLPRQSFSLAGWLLLCRRLIGDYWQQ